MRKAKINAVVIILSILMEFISVGGTVQPVYAKSNTSWKKQYWNYITSTYQSDYAKTFLYSLVYVNNDAVPELVIEDVSDNEHHYEILTTNGKKVSSISGNGYINEVKYSKKNNCLYQSTYVGCCADYIYKISNGQWKIVACGTNDATSNEYYWTEGKTNELGYVRDGNKYVSNIGKNAYNKKVRNALSKYKLKSMPIVRDTYGTIKQKLTTNKKNKKTTTIYYMSIMNGEKSGISSLKVKGNKLVVCGSFGRSSSKTYSAYFHDCTYDNNDDAQYLGYKKRTFTLANNCKFYATGGDDPAERYSFALFKSNYVPNPNLGLGFCMKIKNGKVVAIYTES